MAGIANSLPAGTLIVWRRREFWNMHKEFQMFNILTVFVTLSRQLLLSQLVVKMQDSISV